MRGAIYFDVPRGWRGEAAVAALADAAARDWLRDAGEAKTEDEGDESCAEGASAEANLAGFVAREGPWCLGRTQKTCFFRFLNCISFWEWYFQAPWPMSELKRGL